jgi:hypothetical protein
VATVSLPKDIDLLDDGVFRPDDLTERPLNSTVHHPWLGHVPQPGCIMTVMAFIIGPGGGRQGEAEEEEDNEEDSIEIFPTLILLLPHHFIARIHVREQGQPTRTLALDLDQGDPRVDHS